MRSFRSLAAAAALAFGALSCLSLPTLTQGICGNHIIEQGESCDGAGIGDNTCTATCELQCLEANEDQSLPACPPGYGCGNDRICRRPKGRFISSGKASIHTERLAIDDIDLDGQPDVLAWTSAGLSIAFMDSDRLGNPSFTLDFRSDLAGGLTPTLGFLKLAPAIPVNLFVPTEQGIAVFGLFPDRTIRPQAFPYQFPGMPSGPLELVAGDFDPAPDSPGDEFIAYSTMTGALYFLDRASGKSINLFTFPGASVSSGLLFDAGNDSPGDDIILAKSGSDSVFVFEPLVKSMGGEPTWNINGLLHAPTEVKLPPGATVSGGALVRRLVRDPTAPMDLLILGAEPDATPALYAAFNDGAGNLMPVPGAQNLAGRAAPITRVVQDDQKTAYHVAVMDAGFINEDEVIDFVDADGILLSHCSGACSLMVNDPNAPLKGTSATYIRAVDQALIGQGRVIPRGQGPGTTGDVVAWKANKSLNLYKYLGAQALNPIPIIGQAGTITDPIIGDFNADGVADIATSRGLLAGEELVISFADALGLPTEVVSSGALPKQFKLVAGQFGLVPGADPIQDIVAYSATDAASTFTLYLGDIDQHVVAPILLENGCGGATPLRPSFGAVLRRTLDAAGEPVDATKIGVAAMMPDTGELALWVFSVMETGVSIPVSDLCDDRVAQIKVPGVKSDTTALRAPLIRAVDLDPEKQNGEELLILPTGAPILIVARLDDKAGFSFDTIQLPGSGYSGIATIPSIAAGPDVALFGSDQMNLMGGMGPPPMGGTGMIEYPIVILHNTNGKLDAMHATPIPRADPCFPALDHAPDGGPNGAALELKGLAAINADADADRELVSIMNGELTILDSSNGFREGDATIRCLKDRTDGPPVQRGDLAARDMNGDGVDDIVVGGGPVAEVLLGEPEVP